MMWPLLHEALTEQDGGFPKLGVPFWGPHTKDYTIRGSILGFPYFGKVPDASKKLKQGQLLSEFALDFFVALLPLWVVA